MGRKAALFVAAVSGFAAGPLHAQNTGGVFGPVVNEGHRALEYRMGSDDFPQLDEQGHQLGLFVAFSPGRAGTLYASALLELTDGAADTNLAIRITKSY